jgi:hypothetical protein
VFKNNAETLEIETIDESITTELEATEDSTTSGETIQNPQSNEEKDITNEINLQEANTDLEITESAPTLSPENIITPIEEDLKKEKKSMIWQEVSAEEISSKVIESLTPEKGLRDLANESDGEVLQFAASRLIEGILEGGKAAIWGVKAITEKSSEGPALAMAGEATKKLVSSFTAFTTLGFRAAKKAQELAQKAQAELAAAAEARRKKEQELEEERKLMEQKRMEEERKLMEQKRMEEETKLMEQKRMEEERMLLEQRRLAEEEEEKKIQETINLNSEEIIDDTQQDQPDDDFVTNEKSLPIFAIETETEAKLESSKPEPSTPPFRAFFAEEV